MSTLVDICRFGLLETARCAALAVVFATLGDAVVSAEEPLPPDVYLPPLPDDRRPVRGVETRLHLGLPAYARPLCPRGEACIYGVGGGFGVFVDRRTVRGFSFGVGYELHLHAAEAVYELPTSQQIGVRTRWMLRPRHAAHPVLGIAAGVATFGDVFRIRSAGLVAALTVDEEIELSESLAFTVGLDVRCAAFIPFETPVDGVQRSTSPYVTVTPTLHVGVLWLSPRARSRSLRAPRGRRGDDSAPPAADAEAPATVE